MSHHEQLYRRLLIAYPKAYRRQRGDEIVATILDQEDARGGGVRAVELISVISQGVRLRVVSARPASTALVTAVLAVLIALTVQLVSTPTYAATGAVRILPGATQSKLSHDLESSAVLSQASRSLHGIHPECSVSSASSRGLDLTCHSSGGASATAMVHAVLAAFLREERARHTYELVLRVVVLTNSSGELARQIDVKRTELTSEGRQSPKSYINRLVLHRLESSMALVKARTEALTRQMFGASAPVAFVGVSPVHTFSLIEVSDLLMAALIGLAPIIHESP